MSVTGPQTMDASYCRPAAASRDRRTDNRGQIEQIEGGLLWQSAVTSVLRHLSSVVWNWQEWREYHTP